MQDLALTLVLVLVIPAFQIWKSLRPGSAPRVARYVRSIVMLSVLLAGLAFDTASNGRGLAALGLDWPLSARGAVGMAVAVTLLGGLIAAQAIAVWRMGPEEPSAQIARFEKNDLMPRTPREMAWFALVAVMAGIAWELLYRGFLLCVLVPVCGTASAIAIAAIAYGSAHGYRSRAQVVGSIVSAFAFTIAFALTQSLWWLMLVHIGFALLGGWMSYRIRNACRVTRWPAAQKDNDV